MTFLSNPVVVIVLIALLCLGGVFVFARVVSGPPSMGGGVTGKPKSPTDPTGNMKPGGWKPPQPPTGDGTA